MRAEKRLEAFEWLNVLVTRYPNTTYIISTRPATLEEISTHQMLINLKFNQFVLRPMDTKQIDQFIEQWHMAIGDDSCSLPKTEKENLPQLAQKLRKTLANRAQLGELASNPLLCAMICALHHRYKRELPNNRIRLYKLCLETLLDGRDAERGVDMGDYKLALGRIPEIQPYLSRVAYWMMRHDQSVISRVELRRQLQLPDSEIITVQLVNYLAERSALLQEQAKDEFDFVHRSFQEYLTAERIIHDGDTLIEIFMERAQERRWRDTIKLTAGLGTEQDKKNLLSALINLSNQDGNDWSFRFALECYDLMIAPSSRLRKMIRYLIKKKYDEDERLLDISNSDITSIPPLDELKKLKYLHMRNTSISDMALPSLAPLRKLKHLDISDTAIQGSGLPHLEPLTNLSTLYLMSTSVTDTDLPALLPLTSLKNLYLSSTRITDSGLNTLMTLPNLVLLDLDNTYITDDGLETLSKFGKLKILSLERLKITDSNLNLLAQLPNLEWLYLRFTSVTDAGMFAFLKFPELKLLALDGTKITNFGLSVVSQISNLEHLFLGKTAITDDGIFEISKLSNLQGLNLSHNELTDACLPSLSELSSLEYLDLSDTKISDSGLQFLTTLTKLHTVRLDNTGVSEVGIKSLSVLPELTRLDLKNTGISVSSLDSIKNNFNKEIRIFL